MKTTNLFLSGLLVIILSGCGYQRIGDLTIVANRNVDSKTNYKLIQRNVTGVEKAKKNDALERAIDKSTESVEGGEFLKNVKIYVKNNGKKIKVEGDVWGIPSVTTNITTTVKKKIEFKSGDNVAFKNTLGKLIEGRIAGINENGAVVVYKTPTGTAKKKQVAFADLTKLDAK